MRMGVSETEVWALGTSSTCPPRPRARRIFPISSGVLSMSSPPPVSTLWNAAFPECCFQTKRFRTTHADIHSVSHFLGMQNYRGACFNGIRTWVIRRSQCATASLWVGGRVGDGRGITLRFARYDPKWNACPNHPDHGLDRQSELLGDP